MFICLTKALSVVLYAQMKYAHDRTIFVSAAEASADKHAAGIIRQLRNELPDLAWDGLGGPEMAAAGCKLLENLVDRSAMLTHALGQVGFYFRLLRRLKRYFLEKRPDLVIVIDSPAWNFLVAKVAKKLGIPVLYYIAPQMWAWGAWRVNKLKRRTDRIACILPFEPQWFKEHGIEAEYVGHPLFDDIQPMTGIVNKEHDDNLFPTIALLPGSRKHEIEWLWQPMQKIAEQIKGKFPSARFITAARNDSAAKELREMLNLKLQIEIRQVSIEAATRYADLAVVASGTATLEVAAQHCPMIVMYHVNRIQWHLAGKWIVKSPYICLVNILANKELVPEYVPFSGRINQIGQESIALLEDKDRLQRMREGLKELVEPIVAPGATAKVVEIIKQMLPEY